MTKLLFLKNYETPDMGNIKEGQVHDLNPYYGEKEGRRLERKLIDEGYATHSTDSKKKEKRKNHKTEEQG